MAQDKLVLIHTVHPLIGVFNQLVAERLPDVKPLHVLDEPLLARVRQHGRMLEDDIAALQAHVDLAQEVGACAILVTCSSLSLGVDQLKATIPIVKIDQAMTQQAVAQAKRIGVLATVESTLEPTRTMLSAEAERQGKAVQIDMVLVAGAFDALMRGDGGTHDKLVIEAIRQLAPQVDLIVLAQASMARVLDALPPVERPVPVLTSPHTSLDALHARLRETK